MSTVKSESSFVFVVSRNFMLSHRHLLLTNNKTLERLFSSIHYGECEKLPKLGTFFSEAVIERGCAKFSKFLGDFERKNY